MLHQRFGIAVEKAREGHLSSQNILIDAHWVLVVEGIDTCVHLVD